MYDLNQRDDGLVRNLNVLNYMSLLAFLGLKNPVLNFLKFLSNRELLSYKPFSYKKNVYSNLTVSRIRVHNLSVILLLLTA